MDIEHALLNLAASPGDQRVGSCRYYIFERLALKYPRLAQVPVQRRWEAIWTLIARGLAYVDFSQGNWDNATLELTAVGRAIVTDPDFNPDTGGLYIDQVRAVLPKASATVIQYVTEAHRAYETKCFFATAVMVGVASEAAFLEMAPSFGDWLEGDEKAAFLKTLNNPRMTYSPKFNAFRSRIEVKKSQLPPNLADSLDITLIAVQDTLRVYRNDAGHPTGKQIDRGTAFTILQMAPRYLEKMYELKAFFDQAVSP